jgi:hypothetical protein
LSNTPNKVLERQQSGKIITNGGNYNPVRNYGSNQYEYKSPYKPDSNNIPLSRPSSGRERQQQVAINKQVLPTKALNPKDNDTKVLINPIRLIENPSKRIISPSNNISTPNQQIKGQIYQGNNFLKGNRQSQNSHEHNNVQYGGIVKIIQNNEARPINYRK